MLQGTPSEIAELFGADLLTGMTLLLDDEDDGNGHGVMPDDEEAPKPGDPPEDGKEEKIPAGAQRPQEGEDGDVKHKNHKEITWHFKDGKFTGSTVLDGDKTWEFDKDGHVKKIKIKGKVKSAKSKGNKRTIRRWYQWEFDGLDDKNPKKVLVTEICVQSANGMTCMTTRKVVP